VRALMAIFRGRPGLTNFLGAARAVRDPAGGVIPALAVILGVSVAVLSSVLASTISTGTEAAVWQTVGGDARLSGPTWDDEEVADLREIDGVAQVAAVRPASNTVELTGDVTARGLTVYLVDSTLPEVWAQTPLPPLPEALFDGTGGPTSVLTGGGLAADSGTGSWTPWATSRSSAMSTSCRGCAPAASSWSSTGPRGRTPADACRTGTSSSSAPPTPIRTRSWSPP